MNAVLKLMDYAKKTGLIEEEEQVWTVNTLLDTLGFDALAELPVAEDATLSGVLDTLLNDTYARSVLRENMTTYRDLFDTELMGWLTPRPAEIRRKFKTLHRESPRATTDWCYKFDGDTNYIRRDHYAKDPRWTTETACGALDISTNLSKPEKDPKGVTTARNLPVSSYLRCLLCTENEGYAGRVNHPARQNLRVVPIAINEKPWFLQYSPCVYYNEHYICFNREHTPMKIDRDTFAKLPDFMRQFPHYFVGSNVDLSIVGGSILAHGHFQGGHCSFVMERVEIGTAFRFPGFDDMSVGIVRWPMSVIRLSASDRQRLIGLAGRILRAWRGYTDADAMIFAKTDDVPHNTITSIARIRDGKYELNLVLRNNLTTEEHPPGLYHPYTALHHIRRENISLIEVMRLAVLPTRLKTKLTAVAAAPASSRSLRENPLTGKHADWAEQFAPQCRITVNNAFEIVRRETGLMLTKVLEDTGTCR